MFRFLFLPQVLKKKTLIYIFVNLHSYFNLSLLLISAHLKTKQIIYFLRFLDFVSIVVILLFFYW